VVLYQPRQQVKFIAPSKVMVVEARHCLFDECLSLLLFLLLIRQLLHILIIISKGLPIDLGLQHDRIFPHKVVSDKDFPTAEARVLDYLLLFLESLEVLSQEVGVELGQE
jgi:hypothetical protein